MENEQVKEWAEAQKIVVSIDLVEAAKKHLSFLAAVLRNQYLYEDNVLQRAIYRYNAYWLPLLAKHLENPASDGPLLQYRFDCQKLYGRIIGNFKVMSSLEATSKNATEEKWNKMYPEEPYELDLQRPFSAYVLQDGSDSEKFTSYDLVDAVKRQMAFTYQACRSHMSDDVFLREAMARYKGFLHLIRKNREMNINITSVPTYDIDLMWHTHQLYPLFYCRDTGKLTGVVIQHNDSHPDKSEGSELDNGFDDTTKQWKQSFGSSYWKAGALNRGNIPTPVTQVPYKFNTKGNEYNSLEKYGSEIQFPTVKVVEVLLEFEDISNLPGERKENILISFSKKQPDEVFKTKSWLGISSASNDKMFAAFQCEPKGEFLFEVVSYSATSKSMKRLGSGSLSFDESLASGSQLSINKWISVDQVSDSENSEPVLLHVAMSFSPPMPAPHEFQLVRSQISENDQNQAHVLDNGGRKLFSVQKRNVVKDKTKDATDLLTEVCCVLDSDEKYPLVEYQGNNWSVKGTHGSFKLQSYSGKDDTPFELVGYNNMVKVFPGRKLEFEPRETEDKSTEQDFVSAVEFSTDYPYGRAVALINTKSGTIKATDEFVVLPAIALAFMMSDNLKEEDMVNNVGLGECKGLCYYSGNNVDMVKAADCACGPCKVAENMDPVKNAWCSCVTCKVAQNMDLVKAADCACGPCKVAENMDLVKNAWCSCVTCKVAQNMDLVKAACRPWCNYYNPNMDLVKAACRPWCNYYNPNVDLVKAACRPWCNYYNPNVDLVKAACRPWCNYYNPNVDLVKAACRPWCNYSGNNVDMVTADQNMDLVKAAKCSITACSAVNENYSITT